MSLETIVKHIPGFSLLGRLAPTVLLATSITLACTSERRTEPTPPAAAYGCTTDKDCKGDRVCVEGDCIYPFEREERDVGRQYEDVEREIIDSGRLIEDANQQQDIGNGYEDSGREVIDSGGFVEDIGNVPECIDNDGDGYGIDCERGNDCDDEDPLVRQAISCNYDGDSCGNYQLCVEECPAVPEEKCDGADNDCNGLTDENCPCVDGETQQCGTTNIGECEYGLQTCDINGAWGDCVGNIEPIAERCDGLDNDCDVSIDEDYNVNDICFEGIGECRSEGVYICSENGLETGCNAIPNIPLQDICDGLDNDCDGEIDEDYNLGEICSDGIGECRREGVYICAEGGLGTICNVAADEPQEEICDELDNDCDGVVDNGVKTTFYRDRDDDGFGNLGEFIESCAPPDGYVRNSDDCNDNERDIRPNALEVCNDHQDNNCNGRTDEGASHDYFECFQGDVYWFDSCGNREEREEECNHGCRGGECLRGNGSYCDSCEEDFDCQEGMHCGYWIGVMDSSFCHPEGQCVNDNQCEGGYACRENACIPQVSLVCWGNTGTRWRDSCGTWTSGVIEVCPARPEGRRCEDGECI